MARKKTPRTRANVKAMVSSRLRDVRQEMFGEHGGPELARRLGLPARTWYNYETGVTVPAEVLLSFIEQTGVNPIWLLSGKGPRYRQGVEDMVLADLSPVELIRRGLQKLEESQTTGAATFDPRSGEIPAEALADFIPVNIVSLDNLTKPVITPSMIEGRIMAYRQWLLNPSETYAARLIDDSMAPILPEGSIVAVDRAMTDPRLLHGRIVVALAEGKPVVRRLEISGRHILLRPNRVGADHAIIPIPYNDEAAPGPDRPIVGQVVWSWSRFLSS